MKVYSRTVPYERDGETFYVIPFSDLHYGAAACEKNRFINMLKQWGRNKNALLIDNGDACDCIIAHDHKRFRPSTIDPELIFGIVPQEDWIDQEVNWYCQQIETHVAGAAFLGIASGNHHDKILQYHSTDPTKRIAQRLRTECLGYSYYFHLNFKREGRGYQKLIIYGNHGFGGGTRTEGGSMTKYCRHAERMRADICLYSHDHDCWIKPVVDVDSRGGQVSEVPKLVVDTGTFLKTFSTTDVPTYSELAGYPPRQLGYPVLEIRTPAPDSPHFELRGTV